jgi:hypothetical protein
MENNNIIVNDIKLNFNYVKDLRSNINDIFSEIKEKLNALENIYVELLNKHKNIDSTFGIDSFYFQNKLIEIEYDNIKSLFNGITNRIYCEYYKLYKMIYTYITTELKDTVLIEKLNQKKNYPVYKDLETLKTYNFELIIDIQRNILETIELLINYLSNKESELNYVTTTTDFGINIENLINYQGYSNTLLNEKINIYCKYLNIYNKHHHKYFSRLLIKSKLMIGIVNEDIQIKKSKKLSDALIEPREVNSHSSINTNEEMHIKNFINYNNFDTNLQSEFNSILSNISPPNISPPSISPPNISPPSISPPSISPPSISPPSISPPSISTKSIKRLKI